MPSSLAESVTVVVRTAGERTVDACASLVRGQAPDLAVVPIAEVPFARALQVAFEIGVGRGRPWTLCLDADVLLRSGALVALVNDAVTTDPDVACVEGQVCDLLLARHRPAGCHLYRTDAMRLALDAVEFDPDAIRPERHLKEQLMARGRPLVWSDTVVGLHGVEQWFADVFRTAYVVAHKFADQVDHWAADHWRTRAADGDPDLQVAALAAGLAGAVRDTPIIDRRTYPDDIGPLLSLAGLVERQPLPTDGLDPAEVDARVAAFTPAPASVAWDRFQQTWGEGRLGPLRAMHQRHGTFGLLGEAMRRTGNLLG